MANDRFNDSTADLGGLSPYTGGGIPLESIEGYLKDSISRPQHTCYICTNKASHQILPKSPEYNNAQLQNGLYCCEHCLPKSNLDSNKYGIRQLQP